MRVRAAADLVATLEDARAAIATARRAALADRYAPDAFKVEWRTLTRLETIASAWRELAARALEPNVFYEPAFLLAAAPVFGRGAGVALVWSTEEPCRLLGFFPARIERRRYGASLPILVGFTHPFGPLGVPLVDREAAEPVIAALFGHLATDFELPGLMLLPLLPEDGAFAAALDAVVRRTRMPVADFNRHQRALLAPGSDRGRYVERAIGAHQRKQLRRQFRRLSEAGAVLFSSAIEPAAVDAALADFFRLEASGWKGRAGTAASDHEPLGRFMAAAIGALAAEGRVAIDRILLDGRAIAATIVLRSGHSAWFWKIAYDEALARYSPGVMLTAEVTSELVGDEDLIRTDSCATANHPMIDHLWRERLSLCDRLIAVRRQAPFAWARRLEGLRAAVIAGARHVRRRLRSQRTGAEIGTIH
jgi:CelD/BcsL family acetyltransferase involved in cellulose biosynthesis